MIVGWDLPVLAPNTHLKLRIASTLAKIGDVQVSGVYNGELCTELDSHANMCVLGRHCYILSESGRNVDVGAFTESTGGLNKVPIVDAILTYD